jgi:phospholipid transport system substrate-binding protein
MLRGGLYLPDSGCYQWWGQVPAYAILTMAPQSKIRILALSGLILCALTARAAAGTSTSPNAPMEAAKSAVDDLTEMFKVRQIAEADRQQKLRVIAARHFDFAEMAQSAIGHCRSRFTPAQKAEVIPLLTAFIEGLFLSRIESYSVLKIDQRFKSIQFVKQTSLGPDYAEVFSMVTFEDRENPIIVTYLMRRDANQWKIYDLKIDAISVLANYRGRFDRALNNGGYDGLIDLIRGPQQIAT